MSRRRLGILPLVIVAVLMAARAPGDETESAARLPKIGPASDFALTTQDGTRLALHDLRGKVVVLTFIYTGCADTCPLLTAKLAGLQQRLGADFGPRAFFVSVSVDPERDTPDVLRRYASANSARSAGWAFLTGTPAQISDVTRRYGVYARKRPRGDVDHTFLTSLIDSEGVLRVQYLGVRFDPSELLADIRSLLSERDAR